jgi:hypothetical protein
VAYIIDPPEYDEATGQFVGDFRVQNREMQRGINTVSYEDIDPNEYNDSLDPYLARKAVEADLPIFRPDASDAEITAFWRDTRPLTPTETDAIIAAYAATDNEAIANLLQYRLTNDPSILSEQQRFELGLDDTDGSNEVEATDNDEVDLEQVEAFIFENASDPSEEVAQSILNADIGDTDAAKVVQYLAYSYYNGDKSLDEAYGEALNSGISEAQLYAAFTNLYQHIN